MDETTAVDSVSPDLDAKMDAVFGSSTDSTTSQTAAPATDSPTNVPTTQDTAPPDAPAEEEVVAQPTDQEVAEITGDLDDEIDIAALEAAGSKFAKIDLPRFRQIYQNHKLAKEIQAFAPSVEMAKTHYQRANDMRHMFADYTSGSPERAGNFLKFWQSQSPESFGNLATRALEMAPPEVQAQVRESVITSEIDSAYAQALESNDPIDLFVAQKLDFKANGKYKTKEGLTQAPKADPLDQRLQTIEAKERAYKETQQKAAENQWQSYRDSVTQTAYNQLGTAITDVLKPVAASYANNPQLLKDLHAGIRNDVINAVASDQEWVRQFNLDMEDARQTQDDVTAKALVDMYMAKVGGLIKAAAKPRMAQSAQAVKAASDATHAGLAKSQNKREVVTGGRPAPVAVPKLPAGANIDNKMDSFWKTLDSQAPQPRR